MIKVWIMSYCKFWSDGECKYKIDIMTKLSYCKFCIYTHPVIIQEQNKIK